MAVDGADWHQEGGPTPYLPRRRLESWWKWIEGVDHAGVDYKASFRKFSKLEPVSGTPKKPFSQAPKPKPLGSRG